jgi:hypothetical protein
MDEFGIFYVATGQKYLDEAINSFQSLRVKNQNIPVKLYTDIANLDHANNFFENTETIEQPGFNFHDKINPFINPPFKFNLFLDTDTYVCDDILEIAEILKFYEFGLTYAPGRIQYRIDKIPDHFPEFNTGFIAFARNQNTIKVFKQWKHIYDYQIKEKKQVPHDQPAFREALYNSKLPIYVLPNEYNFRINSPNFAGKNMNVKILHGRVKDYKMVESIVNNNHDKARIFIHDLYFFSKDTFCSMNPYQNKSKFFKVIISINQIYYKLKRNLGFFRTNEIPKRKGN